ncbi:MAG: hypothetical protein R3Y47_06260 [Lachnospiraceae bacterium]
MVIFLMSTLILSSCGVKDSISQDVDVKEDIIADIESTQVSDVLVEETEVSLEDAVILYQGEAFQKSVFSTGSDRIYVSGIYENGDYFIGTMQAQGDVFVEIQVEMDENMRAFTFK